MILPIYFYYCSNLALCVRLSSFVFLCFRTTWLLYNGFGFALYLVFLGTMTCWMSEKRNTLWNDKNIQVYVVGTKIKLLNSKSKYTRCFAETPCRRITALKNRDEASYLFTYTRLFANMECVTGMDAIIESNIKFKKINRFKCYLN